jgi:hypothetical protein
LDYRPVQDGNCNQLRGEPKEAEGASLGLRDSSLTGEQAAAVAASEPLVSFWFTFRAWPKDSMTKKSGTKRQENEFIFLPQIFLS